VKVCRSVHKICPEFPFSILKFRWYHVFLRSKIEIMSAVFGRVNFCRYRLHTITYVQRAKLGVFCGI